MGRLTKLQRKLFLNGSKPINVILPRQAGKTYVVKQWRNLGKRISKLVESK